MINVLQIKDIRDRGHDNLCPLHHAMKFLTTPRIDRCIGCHSCSLACARLIHQQISWSSSGIRIHSAGGLSTGFVALVCLGCDPAPCVTACPTGAFSQRQGGGVIVRKKQCIRCGECVSACPVDAVNQDEHGAVYVCMHCGRCVDFCPHNCLEFDDVDPLTRSLYDD